MSSGKTHRDENFPVASRLVAARHRPAIMAFYRFARSADDVADHPALDPAEKLRLLDGFDAALSGEAEAPDAVPLRDVLAERRLAARHARDLLAAFRLDVGKNRYADWDDLMAYCALSAMPVGRFVLDVHGEARSTWERSDALCAALQVINHLQDCGRDYRELGRVYLPQDVLARHGATIEDLAKPSATPEVRAAIADLAEQTERLLERSAGLAALVRDRRLRLEIAVIQRLAEKLTARLRRRDPLAERVRLGKAATALASARAVLSSFAPRRASAESRRGFERRA